MRGLLLHVAVVLGLLSGLAMAQRESSHSSHGGDLRITLKSFVAAPPADGYFPVEVTIKSRSKKNEVVEINSNGSSSTYAWRRSKSVEKSSNFRLECQAGQTQTYTLLIPVGKTVIGRRGSSHYEKDLYLIGGGKTTGLYKNYESKFFTPVDNAIFSEEVIPADDPIFKSGNGTYYSERSFEPEALPAELKAIQGYGVIYFTVPEWKRLNRQQKAMMHQWVQQGGILSLVADGKIKKLMPFLEKEFPRANHSGDYSYGLGQVRTISSERLKRHIASIRSNSRSSSASVSHVPYKNAEIPSVINVMENGISASNWPLREKLPSKNFGIGLLCLLVIVFMIVIAPLNFFLFARQGKRHKLFFTTPLIAAVASVLLIAFIVFSDGFGGKGFQLVHQEMDADGKMAFVRQEQVCRTGVLFDTSFSLDSDYDFYQAPMTDSRWTRVSSDGESEESYTVSYQPDGKVKHVGNYFSSRSEHGHYLRGSKITHEKFTIQKKGDGYEVTSSFPQPIKALYFRGKKDDRYKVTNLASGVAATATAVSVKEYNDYVTQTTSLFNSVSSRGLRSLAAREMSFIADTDALPGVSSLKSIKWECQTVLTGTFNPSL